MKTIASLFTLLCLTITLSACSNQPKTSTEHCPTPAQIKASQTSTVNDWILYVHNKKTKTRNPKIVSSKLASNTQFKWLQKNAKKLALGRINLWTYKIPGLRTVCDLAGVDYNEFEEVYHLRKSDLMIAFSKKTSDAIVEQWRNAFNEMEVDETIMQIRKKWNMKLEDDPFPEIEDKP